MRKNNMLHYILRTMLSTVAMLWYILSTGISTVTMLVGYGLLNIGYWLDRVFNKEDQ